MTLQSLSSFPRRSAPGSRVRQVFTSLLLAAGTTTLQSYPTFAQGQPNTSQAADVPAPGSITRYVDTIIGTGGTGHTFPGALRPHGMVQLSPDTEFSGWEHASGYSYSDNSIAGFSHMHLSGTGGSDFGDILVAPTVGDIKLEPGDPNKPGSGYRSRFDHKDEVTRAGFYSVYLQTPQVLAQLSVTPRVGIHRYTFPRTDKANLTFEITNQLGGQERTYAAGHWISPTELEGAIFTKGWANDQRTYFVARFSQPATNYGVAIDNKIGERLTQAAGAYPRLDAYATFDTRQSPAVMVKVALSAVDIDGARKNLDAEAPHWDFNRYVREADAAWGKKLSVTQVSGGTEEQRRNYYTAIYHASIHPSLYQDVDGRYLDMNKKIQQATNGFVYHHVYSLWDTYRAEQPLLQLFEPSMNAQFVNGMLERYKLRGELPVWELASCETYRMIGTPAVPVVANAIVNGAPGVDANLAMQAVTDSLKYDARDQKTFLQYGYLPSDKGGESVSKTLEFAYANGAASQMARKLGQKDAANEFWKVSQDYHAVFNPEQTLMWPKDAAGNWLPNFDPFKVDSPYVTQGNSWEYTWHVMHDIPGLVRLYGSKDAFVQKLSQVFDPNSHITGSHHGVTGMIGQYSQGNEPSHHVAYLFSMVGRADLTAKYVQQARSQYYTNGATGLCGNDDAGQMSAWYVFSALGFYPVDPASGEYVLGVPLFPSITMNLENGKTVRIVSRGFDLNTGAPQSVRWNGHLLSDFRIRHADLMQGGTLEFSGKP